MSAGDWGAGTYWRASLISISYDKPGSGALTTGCTLNYDIHVPSGATYGKSYTYTAPTPLPVGQTLNVILAAANAVSTLEGVPLA